MSGTALTTNRWAWIFGSLLLVSLTSLVGMAALALNRKRLDAMLPYLVSLAAGALLGAAGAHLLPEAIQQLGSDRHLSKLLLTGFVGFFLIEKLMGMFSQRWPILSGSHTHELECSHDVTIKANPALRTNLLFGGAIHSIIDGTAIAIAYSASVSAGAAIPLQYSCMKFRTISATSGSWFLAGSPLKEQFC